MRIAVIGTGYVGLVMGAGLAESGNTVVCADVDQAKVARLAGGEIPIFEPGLEPMVQRNQAEGRLRFTTDVGAAVQASEVPISTPAPIMMLTSPFAMAISARPTIYISAPTIMMGRKP